MAEAGWLSRALADVPVENGWLGEREREALAGLRVAKRRADWRLGRWTAKAALAAWTGRAPGEIEVLASADGAPEAYADGDRDALPVALSLSHRAGRALAVVADAPLALGCDLEALEPRSPAFIREWLGGETERLADLEGEGLVLAANLSWTAREAAAKARRQGLRLALRRARVEPGALDAAPGSWSALRVAWEGDGAGEALAGWWRWQPGWVMTVLSEPACERPPRPLGLAG